MPEPPESSYTAPEYTSPGLSNNLPPNTLPQSHQPVRPLAPGVIPPRPSAPLTMARRLLISGGLVAAALLMSGIAVWPPIHDAQGGRTPSYSVGAVLFTAALLYAACVALFADVRDGTMRRIDASGKPTLTRTGYIIFGGSLIAMMLGIFLFDHVLHLYGYSIF